jgi:HEPN domain-containing protein
MNDTASHSRQWIAKAQSDLTAARRLLDVGGPYDVICFHAQQTAEKALKAILAAANAPIPRTHNLEDLQAQCVASGLVTVGDELATVDLSDLTPFAVESRYDIEFWPDHAEAGAAVATATRVYDAATLRLESGSDLGPDRK